MITNGMAVTVILFTLLLGGVYADELVSDENATQIVGNDDSITEEINTEDESIENSENEEGNEIEENTENDETEENAEDENLEIENIVTDSNELINDVNAINDLNITNADGNNTIESNNLDFNSENFVQPPPEENAEGGDEEEIGENENTEQTTLENAEEENEDGSGEENELLNENDDSGIEELLPSIFPITGLANNVDLESLIAQIREVVDELIGRIEAIVAPKLEVEVNDKGFVLKQATVNIEGKVAKCFGIKCSELGELDEVITGGKKVQKSKAEYDVKIGISDDNSLNVIVDINLSVILDIEEDEVDKVLAKILASGEKNVNTINDLNSNGNVIEDLNSGIDVNSIADGNSGIELNPVIPDVNINDTNSEVADLNNGIDENSGIEGIEQ